MDKVQLRGHSSACQGPFHLLSNSKSDQFTSDMNLRFPSCLRDGSEARTSATSARSRDTPRQVQANSGHLGPAGEEGTCKQQAGGGLGLHGARTASTSGIQPENFCLRAQGSRKHLSACFCLVYKELQTQRISSFLIHPTSLVILTSIE